MTTAAAAAARTAEIDDHALEVIIDTLQFVQYGEKVVRRAGPPGRGCTYRQQRQKRGQPPCRWQIICQDTIQTTVPSVGVEEDSR
jgi:hypothetical protein